MKKLKENFLRKSNGPKNEACLCAMVDYYIIAAISIFTFGADKFRHQSEFDIAADKEY